MNWLPLIMRRQQIRFFSKYHCKLMNLNFFDALRFIVIIILTDVQIVLQPLTKPFVVFHSCLVGLYNKMASLYVIHFIPLQSVFSPKISFHENGISEFKIFIAIGLISILKDTYLFPYGKNPEFSRARE